MPFLLGEFLQSAMTFCMRQTIFITSCFWTCNVTVLILFFQKRKVFQVVVLGEIDKAESAYEAMCFVTGLEEEEFISSDSMSKLRQVSSDLCFYQTYTAKNHLLFAV